jgi:hypothetical protein
MASDPILASQIEAAMRRGQVNVNQVDNYVLPATPPIYLALSETAATNDPINPDHYRWHPLGIECIDVTEHFPSNIAHAIEYLWRCGRKDDAAQDLRKAIWYLEREIKRLQRGNAK